MTLRCLLPEGGNWEGGETDVLGRRWYHEPNVGWRIVDRRWIAPRWSTHRDAISRVLGFVRRRR